VVGEDVEPVAVAFEISTTSATMLPKAVPMAMPRARPAGFAVLS